MIRIALCDDDKNYIDKIYGTLGEYIKTRQESIEICTYVSTEELHREIESGTHFDIFLLDVYMSEMTGIDLAKAIRRVGIKAPIIFLTTSKKHALAAFSVSAIQYITKPVDKSRLFEALDDAMGQIEDERVYNISLKAGRTVINFVPRDIVYCESQKNNQEIHTISRCGDEYRQEVFSFRITSLQLFEKLSKFDCFIKIGSTYIVNLIYVKMIDSNQIVLQNGKGIPLPRGTYKEVKKRYLNYYYGGNQ